MEPLFSNMHPSITICFNSPIHTFLCIIPSGGFTHTASAYPHAQDWAKSVLRRTIKWQYRRKIISNFQLAWTTCLKLTKLLLATKISQLFINACKLQLRDHIYTMIHQFFIKPVQSPATYKLAKAHQSLIDLEWLPWLESQVATHTFFIFNYKRTDR